MGMSSITVANGLLANLNFDARVYCVDTWEGSPEHQDIDEILAGSLYDIYWNNVTRARMDHFLRPTVGPSVEVANSWTGPQLDIVFIDGDHSEGGCYNDIVAWRQHMKPDGRMFGHDAAPWGGVRTALERYKAEAGIDYIIHEPPIGHYIWEHTDVSE